jgi:hypothetical protein
MTRYEYLSLIPIVRWTLLMEIPGYFTYDFVVGSVPNRETNRILILSESRVV